ncbi:hypothetical protein PoB_002061400 [Plakobranchus ocellatus]|uniref:Uncharacterized protein n=1 Tax=Plakobranchus ocellatus TaxID=259542 RepID=A0AAV3ZFJ3_9GAST|nr:hypothetical protein PoB_002061400 [Plakobranchus ocellatus]
MATSCVQQQPGMVDSPQDLLRSKPGRPGRAAAAQSRQPGFAVRSLNFDTCSPPRVHTWSSTPAHKKSSLSSTMVSASPSPQANTPDSGISGTTFGSISKTPESDYSLSTLTPPSALSSSSSFSGGCGAGVSGGSSGSSAGGHGSGQRKRKTVTIDESQTSIVMISPDDLFRTYSGMISAFEEHQDHAGESDFSRGGDGEREGADFQYMDYGEGEDQPGSGEVDDGDVSYPDGLCPEMPFGSGLQGASLTDGHPGRFVLDTETGWPLKRSER